MSLTSLAPSVFTRSSCMSLRINRTPLASLPLSWLWLERATTSLSISPTAASRRYAHSDSGTHFVSPKPLPDPDTRTSTPDATDMETTHFGFASVPLSEKHTLVRNVFERVAPTYDLMNDVMSLAIHRAWKRALVAALAPSENMRVLDCAGGTGDVAFRILRARSHSHSHDFSAGILEPVIVCDVNKEMLAVGRKRAENYGYSQDQLRFLEGNAENLPIPDQSIDAYVISFGMRNVPRPAVALSEAVRVLKPGGRFLMLEFAQVDNPLLRSLYDAYSFNVIPALGSLIAGDRQSYQYLVESIRQFPKQEQFAGMMRAAGLCHVTVTDYSFGIVAEYSGFKSTAKRICTRSINGLN